MSVPLPMDQEQRPIQAKAIRTGLKHTFGPHAPYAKVLSATASLHVALLGLLLPDIVAAVFHNALASERVKNGAKDFTKTLGSIAFSAVAALMHAVWSDVGTMRVLTTCAQQQTFSCF